jgi:hypothetical protein
MDWFKTLAPLLGTALAGPLGGAAAAILAEKLGIDNDTVESVTSALNSGKLTSEQITNIKVAEIEFKTLLEKNKIDITRMTFENTNAARNMQIATKSNTPAVMSYLITAGFFGILGFMMTDSYTSSEPLLVMLGSLGTAWVAVVNYWFGSSHGSAVKSNLLSQSVPNREQ